MKSLSQTIKLISFVLLALLLSNCTEDFEETSFQVTPKTDVTKALVDGVVVALDLDNISNGANQESPIPFANIKVFAEDQLIAESTADENGRYSFDFPLDVGIERKFYIETSKPTFLPNVETLDLNESTNQKKFLFKSDDPELELEYNLDEVTISGKINYTKNFYVAVNHRRLDDNGEYAGGWGRRGFFTGTNGTFSITFPRNEEVTFSFSNPYGCDNNVFSSQIPKRFEEDIDIGLIIDISIPTHLEINISDITFPDCISEGELYINSDNVDLENTPDYRLCNNIDEVESFMINYAEKTITNKAYPKVGDELSIVFSECSPYEHSFSLKSSIGNYTEESTDIQVFEHRYSSDKDGFSLSGFEGSSYKLEFQIEDKYIFQAIGTTFPEAMVTFVRGEFIDLNREYNGVRIEGSTPKSFEIKNGFLTGALEATQQWDEGPSIDFEIEMQVPIID